MLIILSYYVSLRYEFISVFLMGVGLLIVLVFFVVYYVSFRFEFRVVMSVTISAYKRCSARLYLQLFVGGLISYLYYLRLFAYNGVQHTYCVVFLLCFSSSCVPYVASFYGCPLLIAHPPFGIL